MQCPTVFRYLNYRDYLNDWFAWWQTQKRKNSHRTFANEAEVGGGTLNNVLRGHRHASADMLDAFNKVIGLEENELGFLKLTASLAEAPNLERRAEILSTVFQNPEFQQTRALQGKLFTYFSSWYNVAIRELVAREDFVEDPKWIASKLMFPLTLEQVQTALDELLAAGLVTRTAEGRLIQQEIRLDSSNEAIGAEAFYRSMLAAGIEGLGIEHSRRYYGAITFCIPEDKLSILRQESILFLRRMLDLADAKEASGNTSNPAVYQLNLQLFPLAKE